MTVLVESVPEGGRVKVVFAVPVWMPVMVVKGPVKVGEPEGLTTMTVPVPSVPDGSSVRVDGREPPVPALVRVV